LKRLEFIGFVDVGDIEFNCETVDFLDPFEAFRGVLGCLVIA